MVTEVRPAQSKNAPSLIEVTLLPMVTEVSPVQPRNVLISIEVTLSGMVTEVRPVQPENALLPIKVTLLGMVTEVRPVQPENALLPIEVTLLGMVTEVRPVQSKNARTPIEVTPSLMITVVMDVLTPFHGTLPPLLQFIIAPVPLMVSVPLLRVAVTSAAFGEPICHVVCALRLAVQSNPQSRIKNNFFILVCFFGLLFCRGGAYPYVFRR
jgi:hypothetical protein